ncbi:hypothetical protein B0H10DRAFT_2141789 [Mycena sp. CBHHK59/15]|nr:hypothetical protein B0H10DRAFT_2141789 [Mycena sp. CBHHK59/15]
MNVKMKEVFLALLSVSPESKTLILCGMCDHCLLVWNLRSTIRTKELGWPRSDWGLDKKIWPDHQFPHLFECHSNCLSCRCEVCHCQTGLCRQCRIDQNNIQ